MKRIALLLLVSGSPFYAMDNITAENIMKELPFYIQTEEHVLQVPMEIQPAVDNELWSDNEHQYLIELLSKSIKRKKFDTAQKLIEIGAKITTAFGKETLLGAIKVHDQDTMDFLIKQRPPQIILNDALVFALERKCTHVAISLLEHGAHLDTRLTPMQATQYEAQIEELIALEEDAPQANIMNHATQFLADTTQATYTALQKAGSMMQQWRTMFS